MRRQILAGLGVCIAVFCTGVPGAVLAEIKRVTVAGGCFWCVEADFESLPGVVDVEIGFTGGFVPNAT